MNLEPTTWLMLGKFTGAGIALGLGGIGSSLGMGNAAGRANAAMMRQPGANRDILRTMLIGQAGGEGAAIFSLVVGLLILVISPPEPELVGGNYFACLVGAGIAIGFGAFGSGLGCGWPAGEACAGIARNPSRIGKLTQSMIIGQAVTDSPGIFSLVVALILVLKSPAGTDLPTMGICIGAGLATGVSALGSGVGSGRTAGGALGGIGRWPLAYGVTLRTMLIGQAVCETPAIFGMLVAFIMIFAMGNITPGLVGFAMLIGAGISVGLGGIGPGIGSGLTASAGCEATAQRPLKAALIMRTMLIGQAVCQSTAIYGLIIALALLYVV